MEIEPYLYYLTWKLELAPDTLPIIVSANCFLPVTHPEAPSDLIFLTILVILRPLIRFQSKIGATNLQKKC